MNIRLEKESDFFTVETLTRDAFWNVYRPGCSEHFVLHNFRNKNSFIKELDFVLEDTIDGTLKIVAHVMFAKSNLTLDDGTKIPCCTFGPISVEPSLQKKGYGKKLLCHALEKARKMNLGVCCICGNINFYGKCGFVVAKTLGINYSQDPDTDAPYFLAMELNKGYLKKNLHGKSCSFSEPEEYFVDDEDVENFDKQFPPKQKLILPGQIFS